MPQKKCKAKTEVYSRVVGYYRPVQQWNKAKQAEFRDRVNYNLQNPTGAQPHETPGEPIERPMCNVHKWRTENSK